MKSTEVDEIPEISTEEALLLLIFPEIHTRKLIFIVSSCKITILRKKEFPILRCGNYIAEGGRSTDNGLQEQLSNRPELHMLIACAMSVREKVSL